jgi:nucleotide-binding universal stress UspA family protein
MTLKILVPHDGTKMSDKAFSKAIELGVALKSEIILLHVIEELPIPSTLILGNDSTLINRSKRTIRRQLERGWNKLAELKAHQIEGTDVEMSNVCMYGPAAEQILHFAKNNDIDMIVMASRRFTGISKIKALGSVTRKVSELAECPVLIIH